MAEINPLVKQMLDERTAAGRPTDKRMVHEVLQQLVLAGLYRGGFFDKAVFYGGTCPRLFHGLKRFSEDFFLHLADKVKFL